MRDAIQRVLAGDCIVYPTTTQPALGCIPTPESLDKLYEMKDRDHSMPVSIGVANLDQAEDDYYNPNFGEPSMFDEPIYGENGERMI